MTYNARSVFTPPAGEIAVLSAASRCPDCLRCRIGQVYLPGLIRILFITVIIAVLVFDSSIRQVETGYACSAVEYFNLPTNRVIELGTRIEIWNSTAAQRQQRRLSQHRARAHRPGQAHTESTAEGAGEPHPGIGMVGQFEHPYGEHVAYSAGANGSQ